MPEGLRPTDKRNPWVINDKYSRSLPLYTVFVFLIVFGRTFHDNYRIYLPLFGVTTFGFFTQMCVSQTLEEKLEKGVDTRKLVNPKPMMGILALFVSIYSFYVTKSIEMLSFSLTYIRSLHLSATIFIFSTLLQNFMLNLHMVSINEIRRGLIGIFQRFFVFIRTIGVFNIWFRYMVSKYGEYSAPLIMYCIIKSFMIAYLVMDHIKVIKVYKDNGSKVLLDATNVPASTICAVCLETITEPIELSCGHSFCYGCLIQCASIRKLCPMCRAPFVSPDNIEMADGYISIALLLCSI